MTDQNKSDKHVDDDAAAWAARRLSGDFSKRDSAALEKWLAADPRREYAYKEYLALADQATHAGMVEGISSHANDEDRPGRTSRLSRRAMLSAPAIAASLAAVFLVTNVTAPPEPAEAFFETAIGEIREVSLPDGTVVTLNTNTALRIAYRSTERNVKLEKGEAVFDVAHNSARPFVVSARGAKTTVLGTEFCVQAAAQNTLIMVMNGVVSVTPDANNRSGAPIPLTAGQEVSVNEQGAAGPVRPTGPGNAATWRLGYLHYENQPLKRVVEDINRYFARKIVLGDQSLDSVRVTGRFDITDQDASIRSLTVSLSLRVETPTPEEIVLRSDA